MGEGRLAGKIALVTGSSSGIGMAIARGFAREGADVVVHCRNRQGEAGALADEIRASGRRAHVVQGDVARAADVARMMAEATTFGPLSIVVCNAGWHRRVPFLEIDEEMWDGVLDADLKGPFLVGQAAARQMVSSGTHGSIIATSSVSAHSAQPELVHYQAAKAGVTMLVRGMALELAPHGIRVNAIAPGLIETNLTTRIFETPELLAARVSRIPLGRAGRPEDLVGAAIFLASDEAGWVSGSTITVDGGFSVT
ncbi:MAG TPA: glucose 1-dehydrogenase [Thermomicrobiaceae bacterium]|nr:glucose 1-dehydrogenase [Thermomicrobiaceae bacterium]